MNSSLENLTTKEKIVRVAMDIIAEEGFHNITIRKIAARAGVNVAAVNYHFGSKDTVINEALKNVTDQLKSSFLYLKTNNEDAEVKIAVFIKNYTHLMFKYPDIIKNMINHAIYNKPLDQHVEYMTFLETEGAQLIKQVIKQLRPDQEEDYLELKTLYLISGLSFPFLMGQHIKTIMGVDLYNDQTRQTYTHILLESICRRD